LGFIAIIWLMLPKFQADLYRAVLLAAATTGLVIMF
jgi:hypothetical protein